MRGLDGLNRPFCCRSGEPRTRNISWPFLLVLSATSGSNRKFRDCRPPLRAWHQPQLHPYAAMTERDIELLFQRFPIFGVIAGFAFLAWGVGIVRLIALNMDIAFTHHRPFDPQTRFVFKYTTTISLLAGLLAGFFGMQFAAQVIGLGFGFLPGLLATGRWLLPVVYAPIARRKQQMFEQEVNQDTREREQLRHEEKIKDSEREQREREEQLRQGEQLLHEAASAQRKRMDIRFACESLYDRHRNLLLEKFPEARLSDYLKNYLGDDQPLPAVEQRAAQLQSMLQEFVDQDGSRRPRFKSVAEIREHFYQERLRVDDSEMDQDLKETVLSDLARDEELAIRDFQQR